MNLLEIPFELDTVTGADAEQCSTADQFRQAFGAGGLMTLGARELRPVPGRHKLGGLMFTASILPMTKAGPRGTSARRMAVMVSLTAADLIDVEVRQCSSGAVHAEIEGVYIDQLQAIALALDWNGDEVLNPRYW